jgi:hypothetical protein
MTGEEAEAVICSLRLVFAPSSLVHNALNPGGLGANGIRLRYGAIRLSNYSGTVIDGAAGISFFFFFVERHLDSGFMDFRAYERPGLSF